MSPHRVRLPRVATLAEASTAGLDQPQVAWRVRVGDWSRLAPSVYCTSPPHTSDDLLRAAALHAAPAGMLTGAGALRLHGFEKVPPATRPLVLVPYGEGVRSTTHIQVRRAAHLPSPLVVDGMAVAPVARAVADHALTLVWLDDIRALVARAVQRHRCTPDQLREVIPHIARRGSGKFRQAVDEVASGARSAPEARVGAVLRSAGLTGFEQNASLLPWGLTYVADVLWRELRAVLEIDSVEFHYDRSSFESTASRDADLKAAGLDVMHVPPSMVVRTPELLVSRVGRWLSARSRDLGVAVAWAPPRWANPC